MNANTSIRKRARCTPMGTQILILTVLIRTMPPDTCIRDHILNLRDCYIPDGNRKHGNNNSNPMKVIFEKFQYWKRLYERARDANSNLKATLKDYEAENVRLKMQLRVHDTQYSSSSGSTPSNRMPNLGVGARQRQQQALMNLPLSVVLETLPMLNMNNVHDTSVPWNGHGAIEPLGGASAPAFALQLHRLNQYSKVKNISTQNLAAVLSSLMSLSTTHLTHTLNLNYVPTTQQGRQGTEATDFGKFFCFKIRLIGSIFAAVVRGLDDLSSKVTTMQDSVLVRQVEFDILQLFAKALRYLGLISRESKGDDNFEDSSTLSADLPVGESTNAEEKLSVEMNEKELASLLVNLLETASTHASTSNRVFKQMLSLLLQLIGKTLERAVFVEYQEKDRPRTESPVLPTVPEPHKTKMLIWTLSHAVKLCSRKPGSAQPGVSVECIQDTLLNGMFGPNDSSFRKALRAPKLPTPLGSASVPGAAETKNVLEGSTEWFIQQVWHFVGWSGLKPLVEENGP